MSTQPLTSIDADGPGRAIAGRRRFDRLYDALAALCIVSVAAALYFGSVAFDILGDFAGRNQLWADRQFALTDLQRAATFLIAPGNDVLRTNDVPKAREIRDRALGEFNATLKKFQVDLTGLVPDNFAGQMVDAFAMLEHERDMMVTTSDAVFAAVAANRTADAQAAIVAMDQRLFELTAVFSECNRIFHEIQRSELAAQADYARQMERYKFVVAGLILLITAGVVLYGARLRRRIRLIEAA